MVAHEDAHHTATQCHAPKKSSQKGKKVTWTAPWCILTIPMSPSLIFTNTVSMTDFLLIFCIACFLSCCLFLVTFQRLRWQTDSRHDNQPHRTNWQQALVWWWCCWQTSACVCLLICLIIFCHNVWSQSRDRQQTTATRHLVSSHHPPSSPSLILVQVHLGVHVDAPHLRHGMTDLMMANWHCSVTIQQTCHHSILMPLLLLLLLSPTSQARVYSILSLTLLLLVYIVAQRITIITTTPSHLLLSQHRSDVPQQQHHILNIEWCSTAGVLLLWSHLHLTVDWCSM